MDSTAVFSYSRSGAAEKEDTALENLEKLERVHIVTEDADGQSNLQGEIVINIIKTKKLPVRVPRGAGMGGG